MLSELSVVGQALVKFDQGLVKPIFQHAPLLVNQLLVLRLGVDTARRAAMFPYLLPHRENLLLSRCCECLHLFGTALIY